MSDTGASDATIAAFFHRSLTLRAGGRRLNLDVSQELFSSNKIDTGTLALLKHIERTDVGPVRSVLDLGTGYGPIAIAAGAMFDNARVVALDRDALAVTYARHNAQRNGVTVDARGSLGYDQLAGERFDLILSNVPGHAGPRLPRSLIVGAADHLTDDGTAAVVIVNPLASVLDELADEGRLTIVEREARSTHTVVRYRPEATGAPNAPAFTTGLYDRGDAAFRVKHLTYSIPAVHDLPEFDSLGFATELALTALERVRGVSSALVWNPGQGHLPVVLARRFPDLALTLVDRDLLALQASARAMHVSGTSGGVTVNHDALPGATPLPTVELAVALLRRKEPLAAQQIGIERLESSTARGGHLLVAGPAVVVDRLVGAAGLAVRHRVAAASRRRGFAASLFRLA